MSVMKVPKKVQLVLLANEVLLPGGILKIPFTTPKSVQIVKDLITSEENPILGVIPCRTKQDLFEGAICTAAAVVDLTTITWVKKTFVLTVMGLSRIRINKILSNDPYPVASVTPVEDAIKDVESDEFNKSIEEFRSQVVHLFNGFEALQYHSLLTKFKRLFDNNVPKLLLFDICASLVAVTFEEKWDVLKAVDPVERLKKIIPLVSRHLKSTSFYKGVPMILPLGDDPLASKDRTLKIGVIGSPPPFINMKNLKRHNQSASPDEDDELEEKIKSLNLPEAAAKVVNRELSQLKRLSRHHIDYAVHRNYLELVAELPWNTRSTDTINIAKSKQDMEVDHYGMEKVKKRVLEYLAVRQLKSDLKGPILCFVGAPGVGKTSVGRSIANSLGRKFHRISLGGVCHHSDIRGHRKTYVGAMPGRIIQAIRSVGVKNPVILLDEIDKLGKSMNGDPASALLEVLDAEQNSNFVDHYLNISFDLSEIIFIATANTVKTIPPALKDRLEIIHMPGYTLEEKKNIAERHLLPKQIVDHGLSPFAITLPEDVLTLIITGYTKEAGVRSLERKLAALCRKAAITVAYSLSENLLKNDMESSQTLLVTKEILEDILGPVLYEGGLLGWNGETSGVSVGLCWTEVGGEVMLVEATRVSGGSNSLILTGQLGSVMKESAKLAFNWFKSVTFKYGLGEYLEHIAEGSDVHIHFPAGAVSKEGPSAGITIAVALVSLFSGLPISPDIALTGELTLRGSVLPVGGIKEKLIAAHNNGIKTVIMPEKCQKYLQDIPKNVLANLDLVLVNDMDEVVKAAFNGQVVTQKSTILRSKL